MSEQPEQTQQEAGPTMSAQPGGRRATGAREPPRPFLKWAGGKTQLVPELLARLPRRFGAYHEPFVGGGALFFALHRAGRLDERRVLLSDVNAELIDTYCAIRSLVSQVIERLAEHRYDRDHFYRVRAQQPEELKLVERAARMIYLNRCGFNGLYRVNAAGRFNVPFGRYSNPRICDAENLRAVARALRGVGLECTPFERVAERAAPGDVVYFDPPYVPLSTTARFTSYARDGFGPAEQQRLAEVFAALAGRGVGVMLSNSDAPLVHELYAGFRRDTVQARRAVNSRKDRRGPVGELLVLGGGLEQVR